MAQTTGAPAAAEAAPPARRALDDRDLPTRMLLLGLARDDGSILGAEAFDVAGACRRSPEQVRSCLRRLVAEGLFLREGTGQRAVYRPTPSGLAVLAAGTERTRLALAQDRATRTWDGRWHLVGFAIPESRRAARDALRERLGGRGGLGGAPIHNGLYVSPHPWEPEVAGAAGRLDVHQHVTTAVSDRLTIGGVDDPRALAARLWPLDGIAERYRAFIERWRDLPSELEAMRRRGQRLPDSAFLPGALAMGLAWSDCFDADPLLPPELLPHPWPGRAARELLVRSREVAREVRAEHDRPALFRSFDDVIDTLPGREPTEQWETTA